MTKKKVSRTSKQKQIITVLYVRSSALRHLYIRSQTLQKLRSVCTCLNFSIRLLIAEIDITALSSYICVLTGFSGRSPLTADNYLLF